MKKTVNVDSVHIDRITLLFIKFCKEMKILGRIAREYDGFLKMKGNHVYGHKIQYHEYKSFFLYMNLCSSGYSSVSDNFLSDVYFFKRDKDYFINGFNAVSGELYYNERKRVMKECDDLGELFMSYLRDHGIVRYMKIEKWTQRDITTYHIKNSHYECLQ